MLYLLSESKPPSLGSLQSVAQHNGRSCSDNTFSLGPCWLPLWSHVKRSVRNLFPVLRQPPPPPLPSTAAIKLSTILLEFGVKVQLSKWINRIWSVFNTMIFQHCLTRLISCGIVLNDECYTINIMYIGCRQKLAKLPIEHCLMLFKCTVAKLPATSYHDLTNSVVNKILLTAFTYKEWT